LRGADEDSIPPFSSSRQQFCVSFKSTASTSRTSMAGNLMNRTRSGNPGYLTGKPVLAGYKRTQGSSKAISALYPGLTVMGPSKSGSCLDPLGEAVVGFGVDVRSGCTLSLSRAQLASMCSGSGLYMTGDYPSFFRMNVSHVGIFGNADPLDMSQWLALEKTTGTPTYTWDAALGICYGFYAAIHYRFLVADVGAQGNPQKKIIAAQVGRGRRVLKLVFWSCIGSKDLDLDWMVIPRDLGHLS
jgi:hypothetical protein